MSSLTGIGTVASSQIASCSRVTTLMISVEVLSIACSVCLSLKAFNCCAIISERSALLPETGSISVAMLFSRLLNSPMSLSPATTSTFCSPTIMPDWRLPYAATLLMGATLEGAAAPTTDAPPALLAATAPSVLALVCMSRCIIEKPPYFWSCFY